MSTTMRGGPSRLLLVLVLPLAVAVVVVGMGVHVQAGDLQALDVDSARVLEAVDFALQELRQLSDSGVYESLSVAHIDQAALEDGVFHENVLVSLHLASPHFKSLAPEEPYSLVVMTHKEDGTTSFAIDEFPVMDPRAVEEYAIATTIRRRAEKAAALLKLELEAVLSGGDPLQQERFVQNDLQLASLIQRAQRIYDQSPVLAKDRAAALATALTRPHVESNYADVDKRLAAYSMQQLFDTTQDKDSTDYEKHRAQDFLDQALALLHRERPTGGDDE